MEAKIIFTSKFKSINLDSKEIISYIDTKYRETNKINKENISNYKSLIELYDNKGNKISEVIKFKYKIKNPNNNEDQVESHFIVIGNENILINLKNNQINEFFMDCTYSAIPPSIYKYKLMVLCGYMKNIKKLYYMLLFY